MEVVAKVWGRVAWAIGGLGEECAAAAAVRKVITDLRTDPRVEAQRRAAFYADVAETLPWMQAPSAAELEEAGQLMLLRPVQPPVFARQVGYCLMAGPRRS